MQFSLIPREMRFFDMFDEFAATLTRAATRFHEMTTLYDRLEVRCHELKRDEDACDAIVQRIIEALDRTFITPFDREDIHALATTMDDIMDDMEKTSYRFEAFRIDKPTPEAVELARIIKECCVRLETAIQSLRDMRHPEKIHALLREVGQLENEADRIYRKTDANLFAKLVTNNGNGSHPVTTDDVLGLIKWHELYEWLEETVDATKAVANLISEIVIKGT